jgi:nicotinamidase-related amidase
MKFWKKLVLWILGAIVMAVVLLGGLIFKSMQPTKGQKIGDYQTPHSALLIVDIQEDYTGQQARKKYKDGDKIVAASNALLTEAQTKGVLVIYIKNVFTNPLISAMAGGLNAPESPGTEMDSRLIKVTGSQTFSKNQSDAFSNQELDAYLRKNQINKVMITGLDAAYCVNATVRGALNRGYTVVIYPKALATESSKSIEKLSQDWEKAGAQVKTDLEM